MARSFRAPAPTLRDLLIRSGKGPMSRASGWWFPAGTSCISVRPQRWQLRDARDATPLATANATRASVGSCGSATRTCPWSRCAPGIASASPRTWLPLSQTRLALDTAHLRTPQPGGTLELDRACACNLLRLCHIRSGPPASVGKYTASGDPATGAAGNAHHFVAGWHTGPVSQTARKIARLAQRKRMPGHALRGADPNRCQKLTANGPEGITISSHLSSIPTAPQQSANYFSLNINHIKFHLSQE